MGALGATLVPDEARILTHCNAGALATAGYGTALGVIRGAVEAGQARRGARRRDAAVPAGRAADRVGAGASDGIDTTVITDNMAGALMRQGLIDLVVVGADRIAANGDAANKIGTYSVAVLAKENGIPFYVAAPLSTIDLDDAERRAHPDRGAPRARGHARRAVAGRRRTAPRSAIRPSTSRRRRYVTAIITERGIARPDYTASLRRLFEAAGARCPRARRRGGLTASRADPRRRELVRRDGGGDRRETGAPDKPWRVRSNVIASQVALHREWGGVVPELASRQHLRDICGVLERALGDAGVGWGDLGAVAVTQGPGLVGSLLVGLQAAKSVALSLDLPIVAVHHLAGHIESLILHNGPLPLPAVVLVVSGGHTSLYLMPPTASTT